MIESFSRLITTSKNYPNKMNTVIKITIRDLKEGDIERNSAYMLFYERSELEHSSYQPDIRGKTCDTDEIDDECEADLKKSCTLQ